MDKIEGSGVRTSSESEHGAKTVKVAMEVNEANYLKKLDLSLTLDELIETLCSEHQMCYEYGKYAIQWDTSKPQNIQKQLGTSFVTESNKYEIKDGSQLKFVRSPSERVKKLMEGMITGDKQYHVRHIYTNSKDKSFLAECKKQGLLDLILELSCELSCDGDTNMFYQCFQIIKYSLMNDFITDVPKQVVDKIINILSLYKREDDSSARQTVLGALKFMQQLVLKQKFNQDYKTKYNLVHSMILFIWNKDDPVIQECALKLINYLLLYANNEEEYLKLLNYVSRSSFKKNIAERILTGTINQIMRHTLYVYQTIIMGRFHEMLIRTVSENSEDVKQLKRTSGDYHLHELESDDNMGASTTNLTEEEVNNERKNTLTRKITSFGRSSNKRSKSLTRPTSKLKTKSEESIVISDQSILRSYSEYGDLKRTKRLNRSSSFKGVLNALMGQSSTKNGDSNPEETQEPIQPTEWKYMKRFQFAFYGKVERNIPKNEKYVYDTPRTLAKTKRRSHSKSESLTDVEKSPKPTWKPPIARKPSNINKKVANFRYRKSADYLLRKNAANEISLLAYENVKYLALKERRMYKRCYLIEWKNGQSFFQIANELTNIICDLLEVGQTPNLTENSGTFFPLVFLTDLFMQELFCETVTLFRRTWKEMRGQVKSDYPKVLDVTKRQLQKSMQGQPATFQQLRDFLRATPYETIAVIRKNEAESQIKRDLEKKPVYLELRDRLLPNMLQVLKKQRMEFMVSGTNFPFFNFRGQKTKNRSRFVRLNKSHDTLLYGEWNEEAQQFVDEKCAPVREILEIITGRKCQHYKDMAACVNHDRDIFFRPGIKQKLDQFEHPFSVIFQDRTSFDVFASDTQTLDYWTDGIRLLQGKQMKSDTLKEELKQLLDIEVRLQLLDVEGLEIPDSPPPVPKPPLNYKFNYPKNIQELTC